jgi:large subunit ribosomal protein L18
MSKSNMRQAAREIRHRRIRKKISGTSERPRLAVYKSCRHVHAQLIDDVAGHTLAQATTQQADLGAKGCNVEAAKVIGAAIAKRASDQGIKKAVFDRGGYPFHGVVKALADSAREGGLEF